MTAGIIKLTEQQFYAFVEDRLDGVGPCRVQENLAFAALASTTVPERTFHNRCRGVWATCAGR